MNRREEEEEREMNGRGRRGVEMGGNLPSFRKFCFAVMLLKRLRRIPTWANFSSEKRVRSGSFWGEKEEWGSKGKSGRRSSRNLRQRHGRRTAIRKECHRTLRMNKERRKAEVTGS